MDLNAWFDRIPRMHFDVGSRRVPAFRSLGIIGFHVAVVVAVLASLRNGVAPVTALGLSAVAGLSFFGWGLLRRAVTGYESLVLLEYVWVAYAAVAGFAWASGIAVAPALDVYSVAVAPFLAFGRMGCTTVGCCHGMPSPIGLRYGPAHRLPERFSDRRLFPVQPIEAGALLVVGAVGLALVGGAPGTATVWFLISYAVIRFGCERLRGDRRPRLLGLPVAKSMCVLQTGAAVAAGEAWLVPGSPGRATWVGVSTLGAALLAGLLLLRARPRNPLVAADHLDAVWTAIATATIEPGGPPVASVSSEGMTIAVSATADGRHVSLSHPLHATLDVALALGGREVTARGSITHLLISEAGGLPHRVATPAVPPVTATDASPPSRVAPAYVGERGQDAPSGPGYFDPVPAP